MDLVTRSDWGARPPRSTTAIATVAGVAVHWEGPAMGTPAHDRCDDHVASIQRFHTDTRGWADIAYNFVVCPHGAVFEGRGWGVRSAANGTAAANSAYHAACYLGGTGDAFTPAARAAYVALVAEARRRYPAGTAVRPHSAFKATDCPGTVIRAWLATDPFAPAPAPAPPTPGDDDMTGAQAAQLTAATDAIGRLEVFIRDPSGGLGRQVADLSAKVDELLARPPA